MLPQITPTRDLWPSSSARFRAGFIAALYVKVLLAVCLSGQRVGEGWFSCEFGHRVKVENVWLQNDTVRIFLKRALVSRDLGISGVPQRHHHDRVLVLGVEEVQGVTVRPVVVQHGAQIVSGRRIEGFQKNKLNMSMERTCSPKPFQWHHWEFGKVSHICE